MNREVIDELIDTIAFTDKEDFCDILESVIEYGFAEQDDLCEMFNIDTSQLDELLTDTSELTKAEYTLYTNKLVKFLKKARKDYERLYFSSKKST